MDMHHAIGFVIPIQTGDTKDALSKKIALDVNFAFLSVPPPPKAAPGANAGKNFSTGTKTAAYLGQALQAAVKCGLCNARLHKNSMHIDHKTSKQDGCHSGLSNAHVTHPYCDSSKG